MIKVLHAAACSIVFILFYDRYWQEGVLKLMKNDHFFSIFSRFGLFPHVSGKVDKWLILKVHEMKIVLHAVACPIVSILFDDRDRQGGVLKLLKNGHF